MIFKLVTKRLRGKNQKIIAVVLNADTHTASATEVQIAAHLEVSNMNFKFHVRINIVKLFRAISVLVLCILIIYIATGCTPSFEPSQHDKMIETVKHNLSHSLENDKKGAK